MKIESATVELLKVPVTDGYQAAGRVVDANWHVLARVRTRDGVEGVGYIVQPRGDLMRTIAAGAAELAGHLPGMDIRDTEAIWSALAGRANWVGPGGLLHWSLAPIDIAVWDALGKTLGQPIFRLLGGHRAQVVAYASDRMWYSVPVDDLQNNIRAYAEAGYGGVKLRLSHTAPAAEQAERVRYAKQAAGPDVTVMVDATEGWSYTQAVETGRALQEAGAGWLEDPIDHQDYAGLGKIRDMFDMPVTGGEHYYTLAQVRDCLEARALDVIILDLARVGGITPWRKMAALGEAYNVPVCGHVVPEVHVHLLASVPAGHMVEYMPRSTEILRNMPEPKGGMMAPLDAPGHGLVLNEKAVDTYKV
ncbi:MAG: mandelate racemase/muconate lactonizing enzyme family protein [Rickettsiales bacterium]